MIYKSYLSYFLNSFYLGEIQFHQVISNFTKILSISPRVFRFHQESCALGEKFFTKSLTKWGGPTLHCLLEMTCNFDIKMFCWHLLEFWWPIGDRKDYRPDEWPFVYQTGHPRPLEVIEVTLSDINKWREVEIKRTILLVFLYKYKL